MKWRQDLNTSENAGNKVKFCVYAEGEGLELQFNSNTITPNIEKDGVKGFELIVDRNGQKGQNFRVSEWGYLEFPPLDVEPEQHHVIQNNDIDFHKYIKIPDYVKENRETYFEKYKSMIKNLPIGEPKVRLEFPSNTISYHKRKEQGTIINSTVSLYDSRGILIFQSSGDGVLEGSQPFGNNHGCYYMIPEGRYLARISNNGNNDKGDESWILAEAFRQDANSPSAYSEFGEARRLEGSESCEFWMNCFDKGQPALLYKINNVSR